MADVDPGEQELAATKARLESWRSKAVDAVQYNANAFADAHFKFLTAPTTLSDADIAQFQIVCPQFAQRAQLRRDGYTRDDTADLSEDEKKELNTPAKIKHLRKWAHIILDDNFDPILATFVHKDRLLEKQITRLAESLETVVTEAARRKSALDAAGKKIEDLESSLNLLLWQREEAVKS